MPEHRRGHNPQLAPIFLGEFLIRHRERECSGRHIEIGEIVAEAHRRMKEAAEG